MKQVSWNAYRGALALVVGTGLLLVTVAQVEAAGRPRPGPADGVTNVVAEKDGGERPGNGMLVTAQAGAMAMVQELLCGEIPSGVEVENVVYVGHVRAGGTFTDTPPPANPNWLGILEGIVLSTGNITTAEDDCPNPPPPPPPPRTNWNMIPDTWWINMTPGDPDVDTFCALGGGVFPFLSRDAAVLQFDIKSPVNRFLRFRYNFGSEEYNEWVTSPFNDGFVLMFGLQGGPLANIAIIGGLPVCVNNVNLFPPNWLAFENNDCNWYGGYPCDPPRRTELDGLTQWLGPLAPFGFPPIPMWTGAPLVGGQWYTVKIAIADMTDRIYDSAVMIKARLIGGACWDCVEDTFVCDELYEAADCTATWIPDVECVDVSPPCGQVGACDFADDTCIVTSEEICLNANGIYGGDGTDCANSGACCFDNGMCDVMTPGSCTAVQGTYQGDGTTCSPIGACYTTDPDLCIETTEACCTVAGGTYDGDGTVCPITGACCQDDGAVCEEMTQVECEVVEGDYVGNGTVCIGDNDEDGIDDACQSPHDPIPAVTEWGLFVMVLLGLVAGTIMYRKWQTVPA